MEQTKVPQKNNRLIIILLLVIILLLCAVVGIFLLRGDNSGAAQSVTVDGTGTARLKYAEAGVVALDQQSLQDAINAAAQKAAEGMIALDYKNIGVSEDGKTFICSLGNSNANSYDMYIDIYADVGLEDQLFLSDLIRPGEKFEKIELNRALDPGVHQVYCAFTQVEPDLETIHGQTIVTLDFKVGDEAVNPTEAADPVE